MQIEKILAPERVAVDVELTSKKAVLERLSEMLSNGQGSVNAKQIFDSLIARERLGTTGLGAGIAIPHGRVAQNKRAVGAFLRTNAPIGFDAVDNAPVDLFFALCVPEDATSEHLQLLASLAEMFSDESFVAELRASGDEGIIFQRLTQPPETRD